MFTLAFGGELPEDLTRYFDAWGGADLEAATDAVYDASVRAEEAGLEAEACARYVLVWWAASNDGDADTSREAGSSAQACLEHWSDEPGMEAWMTHAAVFGLASGERAAEAMGVARYALEHAGEPAQRAAADAALCGGATDGTSPADLQILEEMLDEDSGHMWVMLAEGWARADRPAKVAAALEQAAPWLGEADGRADCMPLSRSDQADLAGRPLASNEGIIGTDRYCRQVAEQAAALTIWLSER